MVRAVQPSPHSSGRYFVFLVSLEGVADGGGERRDTVEGGGGGLPATVLLRYCYLPADRLKALHAAATALALLTRKLVM